MKTIVNNGGSSLLDRYNALSVSDQVILQALSVLLEPVAATVVSSCLVRAGYRESPARAYLPQVLAPRLARLVKEGLAVTSVGRGLDNAPVRLWSCLPELSEIAIRHALRDGGFERLARSVQAEARGKDWDGKGGGESPRRDLRIALYRKDSEQFSNLAAILGGGASAFLLQILQTPWDAAFMRSLPAEMLKPLFSAAMGGAFGALAPADELWRFFAEWMARPDNHADWDLAMVFANELIFRGCADPAGMSACPPARDVAAAVRSFLRGNDGEAFDRFESVAAALRRNQGRRRSGLPSYAGLFQILCLLRLGGGERLEEAWNLTEGEEGDSLAGPLECLRYAVALRQGKSHIARAFPRDPADIEPSPSPFTQFMHGLVSHWINPGDPPKIDGDLRERADRAGYVWFADVLSLLSESTPARRASEAKRRQRELGYADLLDLFPPEPGWKRALAALSQCGRTEPEEQPADSRSRLAWFVTFTEPSNAPCPVEVRPVEQFLGRDGRWSRGKPVSLKRLFHSRDEMAFLTAADRAACAGLRFGPDYQGRGFYFDHPRVMTALVGHPLVFRADAQDARIDVENGEIELVMLDGSGSSQIVLSPSLGELFPDGIGNPAALPDVVVRQETPTRLRVFKVEEIHKRLASIVGEELHIPSEGRVEALESLARLSSRVRVHAGGGLAGAMEGVEADAKPRFHLLPVGGGLRVEMLTHPFGLDGPAYRPGEGGQTVFADNGGQRKQTRRDLRNERELAESAVTGCPALREFEDGEWVWRLSDPEDCLNFLMEAQELGDAVELTWPKGGQMRVRRASGMGGLRLSVRQRSEWFDVSGELAVEDGLVLDMAKLLDMAGQRVGRFIPIGEGEFIALTDELRQRLSDLETFGEMTGHGLRLHRSAAFALDDMAGSAAELDADEHWLDLARRRQAAHNLEISVPASLAADLRDYQAEGFCWLARLAEWGAGGCLADDMGLGKTVQALALILRRASQGPALAVAPTSVCHNWISEAARFAPSLRVLPFGEGNRARMLSDAGPHDFVVASYGMLQQEEELFSKVKWATAVLDEAQAIKNMATKRSQAAMTLNADFRFITTGTPIENHLGELWNLFRFINPGLLGSAESFQRRFAVPIERFGDKDAEQRLRRLIQPFIMRRTKSQVLSSLPPRTEIVISVELGEKERAFYEALRRNAVEKLSGDNMPVEEKRFQILAEIMRLRRACCNPELVAGPGAPDSAKLEQFGEIMGELLENKHKVLIFSQFVDHLSILRRRLDADKVRYQYLDGSTPARARKKAVQAFQNGDGDAFLISLRAGGLGINLTAADYVLHMDPWWNPAVEDQASDRAHRIGQTRPVTIYRLVTKGTIEEKIVDLHGRKRDLADSLLSGADTPGRVDWSELWRLIREE